MKAVLMSTQPKWCELIARAINPVRYSAFKTIEVRKTRPKIETPFKVYIYCTKAKEFFVHGGIRETLDDLYRLPSGEIKYGYSGELMCYGEDEYDENNFLNGKVIGEFICNEITVAEYGNYCVLPKVKTMIDELDLLEYANEKTVYGWHISDLVIYDKPKELSEFYVVDYEAVNCCEHRERIYNNPDFTNGAMLPGSYLCEDKNDWCTKCKTRPITRPPQSWCYVEELQASGF